MARTAPPPPPPRKFWSPEDVALLRRAFPHQPTEDVAALLGRTSAAVASHARAIGLSKTRQYRSATTSRTSRERSRWTPAIEEMMVLLYPSALPGQLQDLFGIPSLTINQKALHMGLHKNQKTRSELAKIRQRARQQAAEDHSPCGASTTHARHTRPPHKPGKTASQPLGTVRLRTWSGVPNTLMEKVGFPSKWRQVHQLVWEHANGRPIPRGHIVTFRDKNRHNLNPENLELMGRRAWAQQISPLCNSDACPELNYITRLRGTLNRVLKQADRRLQRSTHASA